MPRYCVETSFHLPTYHHTVVEADSPEDACRLALENDDWSDAKQDPESAGETYVSGIWIGTAPYEGESVEVPTEFEEGVTRRATHYLETLMLLVEASYGTFESWRPRVSIAIQKARAIFDRRPDPSRPTEPADIPGIRTCSSPITTTID
jgi:hypothetical protein